MSADTFCSIDEGRLGLYQIQWQFPQFTLTCSSHDLNFAREILNFIAETRGNPIYRDMPLSNGVYRCMEETTIDLSQYFHEVQIVLEKLGESDHSYILKFSCENHLSLVVTIHGEHIDSFLDGIHEIIEDYLNDS